LKLSNKVKKFTTNILPRNPFAQGVGVLASGTAGAQVLALIAAPLLTRLYSPEDYGLLGVFTSVFALISVISSLRYELAIPLPEDDGEAANVASLSLILVVGSTLLTVVLVLFLRQPVADLLGVSELAEALWLLPVGVLFGGAYNIFNYWAVRSKRFGVIAGTKLRQALAILAIQLGAFKLGNIALVLGQVTGQGIGTTSLSRAALTNTGFRRVNWQGIAIAAIRFRQFPLFSTWGAFVDTASTRLPLVVLFGVFGPSAAGFLSISERVLQMPASLIGGAIGQAFLSSAPNANRSGNLQILVQKVSYQLIHIGLPPAMLIFFISPDAFSLLFGENWRQAGEIASWMTPWVYFQFISSPLSMTFAVTEKLNLFLWWQSILLFANGVAVVIGVFSNNLLISIVILSAANSACYAFLLAWIARLSGNSLAAIFRPLIFAAMLAVLCSAPVFVAQLICGDSAVFLSIASAASFLLIAARFHQIMFKLAD
jgi:O-antigen/teichoic acid export membrane protein